MVLDGCIPELDQLAEMFGQDEIDRQTREQLLQDATRQVDKLNENLHKSGQVYVKIMQKILDKGHDFVQSESERVSKILREKLSPIKKKDLEGKLNILQSFAKQLVQSSKVEL